MERGQENSKAFSETDNECGAVSRQHISRIQTELVCMGTFMGTMEAGNIPLLVRHQVRNR
jgi:hypothetical protein